MATASIIGFFDDSAVSTIVDEILKMKDLSHPNILTLMGVALDTRHSPCLVMPFMANGSLCLYLRREDVREELLWAMDEPKETVV